MDHLIFCDDYREQLKKVKSGEKTKVIFGANSRIPPHSAVYNDEKLYFFESAGETVGFVTARAKVADIFNSERLTREEAEALVDENINELLIDNAEREMLIQTSFICIVTIKDVEEINPPMEFMKPKTAANNWAAVDSIQNLFKH